MNDKKRLIYSLYFPVLLILILLAVRIFEVLENYSLAEWGVYPRSITGIKGIFSAPLVHADFKHLLNNAVPLFVITWMLLYFYREISYRIFFLNWIITGLWVWVGARESFHIGASGIVYGIISFLFFSGVWRRDMALLTISLLMVFLYGSMIWGVFPFVPDISWESHLSGGVAGLVLSYVYRKQGPQRKEYHWSDEEPELEVLPDEEIEVMDNK